MLSGEDHLLSPTLVMPSTSAPALPECHISTSNPLWMKPKFSSFIPESLFCFKLIGVPWGNIFCLSLTFLHAFLKKTHLFYLLNCKSSREKSYAFFVFVSAATSNAIIIWELQMNKWSEVRSTAYLVFFFFLHYNEAYQIRVPTHGWRCSLAWLLSEVSLLFLLAALKTLPCATVFSFPSRYRMQSQENV